MFRLFFVDRCGFVKFITVQSMICCLKFDFSKTNHGDLKWFCYKKLVREFNKIISDDDLPTSEHTALTVSTYIKQSCQHIPYSCRLPRGYQNAT